MYSASASSSASQDAGWGGNQFGGSGAGDWNVNLSGGGFSLQGASSGISWMLLAAAAAAYFILK